MVILPNSISSDDNGWVQACALMLVLPLDPRCSTSPQRRAGRFYQTADELLERPNVWSDQKQVPAPYFTYCLRFSVSASIHGSIPIDDAVQISEFKRVVNAALQGELTMAERRRWEANDRCLDALRKADTLRGRTPEEVLNAAELENEADRQQAIASEEGAKATRFYFTTRNALVAARQIPGAPVPSKCLHDEVMASLAQQGASLQQAI